MKNFNKREYVCLNDGWLLKQRGNEVEFDRPLTRPVRPVRADLPGYVHEFLFQSGVIADPLTRRHEDGCQWVEDADWSLSREFEAPNWRSCILVIEGIDTFATILVNGQPVLQTESSFQPFEVNLSDFLNPGINQIEINFRSTVQEAIARRAKWLDAQDLPRDLVLFDERAFVRKPGFAFGWDWGPRLVSPGITGNVFLCPENPHLVIDLTDEGDSFLVTATQPGAQNIHLDICGEASAEIVHSQPDQMMFRIWGGLWNPAGYGEQILHTLVSETPSGTRIKKRFGLRRVELRREQDEFGESVEFVVNGQGVWARGANWIPHHSFVNARHDSEIAKQIETFRGLNFNMLRVWGGGRYECDAFYDACDESGILVWQDAPFACSYIPDDAEWAAIYANEVRTQAEKLRHHPSLCLWCGNNENQIMFEQKWGGNGTQVQRYFGEHIYRSTLPEAIQAVDPNTPYIETSPIGKIPETELKEGDDRSSNAPSHGDCHYWEVWHGKGDWRHYVDCPARFCSEFGFASSCSLEAWQYIYEGQLPTCWPDEVFFSHDKTNKPWATFKSLIELHYKPAETLEDWIYSSQLNQRDAMRFGIEWFRRYKPCRGALIWQANDCWPVSSWAIQDFMRNLKPAGQELRRLYSDVMISIQHAPNEPEAIVWVCNSGLKPVEVKLRAEAINWNSSSSTELLNQTVSLSADDVSAPIRVPLGGLDTSSTAIRLSLDSEPDSDRWLLLVEPRDASLPRPRVRFSISDDTIVSIDGFVFDLVLWDEQLPTDRHKVNSKSWKWNPKTGFNLRIAVEGLSAPENLKARSIAGIHEVVFE